MNASCDAAEQVVRMSLEGTELAVKIVGKGAKKTKGKARLASLLKSGKELKVYSLPEGGLKKARKAAWLCKKREPISFGSLCGEYRRNRSRARISAAGGRRTNAVSRAET